MINSFYCSFKLTNDEGLVCDKCFDVDENTSLEIYSIGIRRKYLELFLR